MKKCSLIFLCVLLPLFLIAEQDKTSVNSQAEPLATSNAVTVFTHDASGNRTSRNTIRLRTQVSDHESQQEQAPRRAGAVPRDAEDEEDYCSDAEAYFFASNAFEMPENNEVLEHFYTDRLNESDVVIFPNPTRGALAVEILNKNPNVAHQITVLTVRGLVVFRKDNITSFTEIDLSAQPRGVYLLRISSQDRFITWKIIKE